MSYEEDLPHSGPDCKGCGQPLAPHEDEQCEDCLEADEVLRRMAERDQQNQQHLDYEDDCDLLPFGG